MYSVLKKSSALELKVDLAPRFSNLEFARAVGCATRFLGLPVVEFSGVNAHSGGSAAARDIGGLLPIALCGRTSLYNSTTDCPWERFERELHYSWHPWTGRRVFVHEVIDKNEGAVPRCSLSDQCVNRH